MGLGFDLRSGPKVVELIGTGLVVAPRVVTVLQFLPRDASPFP